jgi:hypothetical protein
MLYNQEGNDGGIGAGMNSSTKPQNKKRLGIGSDVVASAGIPIPAPFKLKDRTEFFPNLYEFPIARLVKVNFDPEKDVKRGDTTVPTPILSFVFVTGDKKQYTHVEFPIEDDDAKFDDKFAAMQQRIKHIFIETIGESKFEEGAMSGDDFKEFFDNVAKSFNNNTTLVKKGEGEEAKPVPTYTRNSVYIKLVYYKTRLQLPLYPNFVQKAFDVTGKQVKCELQIDLKYDKVEAIAPAAASGNYSGGTHNTFGGGSSDSDDFPDVP